MKNNYRNSQSVRSGSSERDANMTSSFQQNSPATSRKKIPSSAKEGMTSGMSTNGNNHRRKKKISAARVVFRAVLVLLVVLIVASLGLFLAKEYYLGKINIIEPKANLTFIDENGSAVKISDVATESTSNPVPSVDGIHNILLIGIDSRESSYTEDGAGHLADIIMILTINENDNSIKLTSIQRDSYVYIPGYTNPKKVNATMTYGGPELLMLVLNNTLRLNMDEYAYVDLNHMEKVVNAVGGVTVNVSESERTNIKGGLNELVAEQNMEFGSPLDSHMLTETGDVTLDGRQAVAYARIRMVGNGDYDRSKRQIEVLTSLMTKFMDMSYTGKAGVLDDVLSLISTNIQKKDIEWYALTFLPGLKSSTFEYLQIPVAGYSNEGMYTDFTTKDEWSIRPNWNGMIPIMQEYMYGKTFPFDPVATIPGAPKNTPTPAPTTDDTNPGGN